MTPEQRGALMARIRSKDTAPEMIVRSLVHRMGFRFRLHQRHLPGKPDLVFPRRKCVVFVHGCFWHRHGCRLSSRPKANSSYWEAKIAANMARDLRNRHLLEDMGWRVAVIWECVTRQMDRSPLERELRQFLAATGEREAGR